MQSAPWGTSHNQTESCWLITLRLPGLLHGYFMSDEVLSPGTGRCLLTHGGPCSVLVLSQIQIHCIYGGLRLLLCKCPGASLTGLHSLLILFLSSFLKRFLLATARDTSTELKGSWAWLRFDNPVSWCLTQEGSVQSVQLSAMFRYTVHTSCNSGKK